MLTKIADALNGEDVPTARGGTWWSSTVSRLLNGELQGLADRRGWPGYMIGFPCAHAGESLFVAVAMPEVDN